MTVKVKLSGGLGLKRPDTGPLDDMEVEIPDGANVVDLLSHLGMTKPQSGVVSVNGRILKSDAALEEGMLVYVFPPMFGG